jgi:hypothetical protein
MHLFYRICPETAQTCAKRACLASGEECPAQAAVASAAPSKPAAFTTKAQADPAGPNYDGG